VNAFVQNCKAKHVTSHSSK